MLLQKAYMNRLLTNKINAGPKELFGEQQSELISYNNVGSSIFKLLLCVGL